MVALRVAARNYWEVSLRWRRGVAPIITVGDALCMLGDALASAGGRSNRLIIEGSRLRDAIIVGNADPEDKGANKETEYH